ncbi:quercetin dioxygenase-like cupin family protein [Bradyrhizobium sp. AZCC 2262]|uniref:cupin domain-containing protein n=1 Tax=Bradyrhizobium sp. AZCC 2262 TaxID=3117022 RepID=UPI002FEFB904
MSAFNSLAEMKPLPIWGGILARVCQGREMTFAVAELDAGAVAARHQHVNEQVGLVLQGTCDFEVGGERRQLKVGDTYLIPANTPHEAIAGPQGCVLIDVFAPIRDDWARHEPQEKRAPKWPAP